MARDRLELQAELESYLGGTNPGDRVYYQPPENVKLAHPCIVYSKAPAYRQSADNIPYVVRRRYDVTLIDRSPDHPAFDALVSRRYTSHTTSYVVDGLNHDVFDLYH